MKIYIATHKKVNLKLPKNYKFIQVNAQNSERIYDLTDADGENISYKNQYYCELTAAYWVWKNDTQNEIVGLAHYRRFLTKNKFSSKAKYFINNPKIEKVLNKYDFIATKKYKTATSVKEHLLLSVREKDYNILKNIIKEYYPQYEKAFLKVFYGKRTYLLNTFICKKQTWNNYYSWLFSIFEKMEKEVNMQGYSNQEKRLYGYLAERLFTVFVEKNLYKVKSFPTCIIGKSKFSIAKDKLKIIFLKKDF
ncbi:MAG: DUF4422 domain-containing protein [Clostridiales bacterium]|nr:DUF4422 domain-containing protein [Clostridiales bacterium]